MPKKVSRRSPEERRQEIIEAALSLADTVGLDRITSRDVAQVLGVTSGLIHHYFPTVDDLVVAAFAQTAAAHNDRDRQALHELPPAEALAALVGRMLGLGTEKARIWMSAWVAAPRRPELAAEVDRRMLDGLDVLTEILRLGRAEGAFQMADPKASALRILVLVDGVLVQTSMRGDAPYGDVHALVWDTVEREVGMPNGSLRSAPA
ncbi:TetR/AcrR family transcriptional regulator [Streptomyces sp. NBC_01361]|uniref:TetR/AcrR family transcriptional regulator n=1 Tax=Streptomyces sp. NBC_01361 TaxID=2903838 RepID=UPI002E337A21|nr:TetR/AcrR family transcriptional regulator [Streptomyces sp. NBC_01361]